MCQVRFQTAIDVIFFHVHGAESGVCQVRAPAARCYPAGACPCTCQAGAACGQLRCGERRAAGGEGAASHPVPVPKSRPFGPLSSHLCCRVPFLQAHVRRFPKSHPFAHLSGTENIIAFTTLRYRCGANGAGGGTSGAAVRVCFLACRMGCRRRACLHAVARRRALAVPRWRQGSAASLLHEAQAHSPPRSLAPPLSRLRFLPPAATRRSSFGGRALGLL